MRKFAVSFINNYGVPRWRENNMGSWPEHIASWLYSANKVPGIYIKYEDLRMDTASTLKRVISFLGEEPDESKIQIAIKSCAIDKVRKLEVEDKKHGRKNIFGSPGNDSFIGKGEIAQSLDCIGEDIEALYQKKFGNFIHMFGY